MSMPLHHTNEKAVAEAFSKQSAIFDTLYGSDSIIAYKRQRVRQHLQQYLQPGSHVLELNCGTGEDAIWLAQQGHTVHATDIAPGMLEQLQQKINTTSIQHLISTECISFTNLQQVQQQKLYNHIFSNFAGLNCTGELNKVLQSFHSLLEPGGIVTLVVLPSFCLWETLLLVKGKTKTAFRRFFSSKGVKANVENTSFTCWYYNPSYIIKTLQPEFKVLSIEGLCTIVPPSYMEGFAEKHPRLYRFLQKREDNWKQRWPWKYIGDYYIISLQKQ
ncbi:MAG: class I SAM-dependent methyltransferase [Bacteroidetes bacterium]|nr:class I SAM-dependent methyltransferase [Bacteroidota bacterium]